MYGVTTLRCTHCRAGGGPSVSSEVDVTACKTGQVDNIQGGLECKPPPNARGIPPGGYVHSCLGCRLTSSSDGEHILECSHCSTADGHRRPTHTSIGHCPSGSFDNQDGALSCAPLPNSREVPAGPYLSSCLGCTLHRQGTSVAQATAPREALRWHTVLRCTHCRRADGVQVETSFTDPAQCLRSPGALLDNQNGELVCKLS